MERIILIPAYEPDEKLLTLVDELKEKNYRIVVVNDGSSPSCERIFEQAAKKADVIAHQVNMGKGEALKTGLLFIRQNYKNCVVVTADADGQHKVRDIARVGDEAERRPGTLILGGRKLGKGTPLRSRLGNGITRFVYQASSHEAVYDTQTGLRAFTMSLIDRMLSIEGQRYEYEMNVLMEMAKARIPMKEIEIETVYLENNRSTHFDTVKDSVRIYWEILKFSLSSFLSFLLDYGLFLLFTLLTGQIIVANIAARLISGTGNFLANKYLVFAHNGKAATSAAEYFVLAVVILVVNSLALTGLVHLGLPAFGAKLLVEALLFTASFLIQHNVIFQKKEAMG